MLQLQRSLDPDQAAVVASFLKGLFDEVEIPSHGLLALNHPQSPIPLGRPFFCIVIGEDIEAQAPREMMQTAIFASHSVPLEHHLGTLDPDVEKVVLVITSSAGLSQGVRRKLFDYRNRFKALVLPLAIAEIRSALRRAFVRGLFLERLEELHAPVDPFGEAGPKRDRLAFVGNQRELNQVLHALDGPGKVVLLTGRPGLGKSSLLNMAELDCPAVFVRVRCSSLAQREVDSLVAEVVRALGRRFGAAALPPAESPAPAAKPDVRQTLFVALPPTANHQTVLVLEDADCLVEPLEAASAVDGEPAKAHQFWSTVAEWCDLGRISVVVTGVRVFLLKQNRLLTWENPLATHCQTVELAPFRRDVFERYLTETAAGGNVVFEPSAVQRAFEFSGGYVDVARQLCSIAFRRARDATPLGLQTARVDQEIIETAADTLVSSGEPFKNLIACLRVDEQIVLEEVALRPGKSLATLKRRLVTRVGPARVRQALNGLQRLGLVSSQGGRERLTIPLLQRWLTRNADPADLEDEPRDWRGLAFGVALAISLFGVWGWLTLTEPKQTETVGNVADCTVKVFHDAAAAPGQKLKNMLVECDCVPSRTFKLVSKNNVADFVDSLRRKSAPIACGPAASHRLEVTPGSPFDDQTGFTFALVQIDNEKEQELFDFTLKNDWLQVMKSRFQTTVAILGAASGLVGGLISFSTELRGLLARLAATFGLVRRRRKDSGNAPPSTGTA